MEGADLLYVSYQLGHAKPTTTLLYYAHFMPRGDKKHLDRMMARRGSGFSPLLPNRVQKGLQALEVVGSPGWARTSDFLINSQALYRLSYRGMPVPIECCEAILP